MIVYENLLLKLKNYFYDNITVFLTIWKLHFLNKKCARFLLEKRSHMVMVPIIIDVIQSSTVHITSANMKTLDINLGLKK